MALIVYVVSCCLLSCLVLFNVGSTGLVAWASSCVCLVCVPFVFAVITTLSDVSGLLVFFLAANYSSLSRVSIVRSSGAFLSSSAGGGGRVYVSVLLFPCPPPTLSPVLTHP